MENHSILEVQLVSRSIAWRHGILLQEQNKLPNELNEFYWCSEFGCHNSLRILKSRIEFQN